MNKILEVKEYDLLTCSEKYRNSKGEGKKYHFIEKENFEGLVHFIDKMTGCLLYTSPLLCVSLWSLIRTIEPVAITGMS